MRNHDVDTSLAPTDKAEPKKGFASGSQLSELLMTEPIKFQPAGKLPEGFPDLQIVGLEDEKIGRAGEKPKPWQRDDYRGSDEVKWVDGLQNGGEMTTAEKRIGEAIAIMKPNDLADAKKELAKVTVEEVQKYFQDNFDKISKGDGGISADDLSDALTNAKTAKERAMILYMAANFEKARYAFDDNGPDSWQDVGKKDVENLTKIKDMP